MAEKIVIDRVEYLIDEKGAVYDIDTNETAGVYDCEKKVWISRDELYGYCLGDCCM